MIGRAALGRPWLFRQAQAALAGQPIPPDPTPAEQGQLLLDHYRLVVEQFGPEKGTVLMRRYRVPLRPREFRCADVSQSGQPRVDT